MFDMLDLRVDLVYDVDEGSFTCVAAVWDGDQYVAAKRWSGDSPRDLLNMVTPFWLYWSALYYDSHEMTPKRVERDGFEQLRLWSSESDA